MRGIVASFQSSNNWKEVLSNNNNNNNEPISVLDTRRSPSPSTSTSTPSSSSVGGGNNTTPPMLTVNEWPELQPIPPEFELRFGGGLEDWESLLSETAASLVQDQSLRWISGDFDDASLSFQQLLQTNQIDQTAPPGSAAVFEAPPAASFNNQNHFPQLPPPVQFHRHNLLKAPVFDPGFRKDSILNPGLQKDLILNPGLRKVSILNQDQELPLEKPSAVVVIKQEPPHQHQQLICDHLFAAAELMLSGNRSHTQGILARLNHHFTSGPTLNKPFQRAAFYFKEAMQMQSQSNLNPNRITAPVNGMFKMGAYKMFSEVSPIIQFINFTSNQTLLEAIGDANNIHIIDFDIGFGAQWASFIQELPLKNNGCSLKITAFASPSTHHPLELGLMHENLSQLAQETGVSFKLEVVNFDSFDPRWFTVSETETIVVNFPIWSVSTQLSSIPSILHFVKQLRPRIVVSADRGCERTDLPFPGYLLKGLQYYEVLFDSIDAANDVSDSLNKIECYLFRSQIERMVSGKLQSPEPMPHWRSLFAAGGYSCAKFSNFAETQAECVLKRMRVQGFRVEKRQAALVLCWQDRELMTVSAWKC
ncbi:scarecrow-like protein 6 [Bidens hawaiensis]|uniref:scarecrow-like protein 6 n=1 Tax=Bidens hawaiensis TaxID=980011 RepID=UPI00404AD1BF